MKIFLIFVVVLLSLSGFVIAQDDYPKLNGYVNDFAGLLNGDEELQLIKLIEQIEKNTSVEIAVVTILNTGGNARIAYATELGEHNGVGKKSKDNGIVILWSLDNEKGGAIATGRGIESILNDAKVTRIGRASREYFDKEQYYPAFEFILNEIKLELNKAQSQGDPLTTGSKSDNSDFIFYKTFVTIAVLVLLIFIIGRIFSRRGDSSDYSDSSKSTRSTGYKYIPIVIPPIISSGSSRSSYKSSDDDDDDDDYSGRSSSYVGSSYSGGSFSGFGSGSFGGGGGAF